MAGNFQTSLWEVQEKWRQLSEKIAKRLEVDSVRQEILRLFESLLFEFYAQKGCGFVLARNSDHRSH